MKLLTRFELAAKNTNELRSLHKEVFNALVKSEVLTLERVNALDSLENTENEFASRATCPTHSVHVSQMAANSPLRVLI